MKNADLKKLFGPSRRKFRKLDELLSNGTLLENIDNAVPAKTFRSKAFTEAVRLERKIWHPALFKSASTYLDRLMDALYGDTLCGGPPIPAATDRMQEPDPVSIFARMVPGKVYYSHHIHMRRTSYFERNLLGPKDKVIYQTRTTADVIVSLYDHLERQRVEKGELRFFTYTTADNIWARASRDERFEFIVFSMLPFILDMDASWQEDAQTIVLDYDEVTGDPESALGRISEHLEMPRSKAEILESISKVDALRSEKSTNHNVGVKGRGKELIPPDLLKHIDHLKARWQPGA